MELNRADLTVDECFFEPALRLLNHYCRHRRDTPELSDERFVREGLYRVIGHWDSGRDFLQVRQDGGEHLPRATWFDALHSRRRATMVAELAVQSYELFDRFLQPRDWLKEFPELAGRASHADRDAKDELVSVGVLYGLCLHAGLQRPLAPFQGDGVRHHELPIFKQQLPDWLKTDRGQKMPILIGDPAYIDMLYWFDQHRLGKAAMITREKENMKPLIIGPNPFDRTDPVNRGVEADELAGYTYTHLRRIVYRDPASGERFVFMTTETNLRPGVIALLYLLRWKIEKVFDVSKNKLHQQKAWANGDTAARHQSHFIALTHNLLTILLATLEHAGVRERKVERKQADRIKSLPAAQRVPAQEMVRHAAQLTCQFIRLVRFYLDHKTSWRKALPRFQLRLESYL
jgi:hypothetical protein